MQYTMGQKMCTALKNTLIIYILLVALLLGERACPAFAAVNSMTVQEKAEFGAFVDGFIQGNMKRNKVPGMVFAAVRNGEPIFIRGYGWADVKAKTPVDPDTTVFRAGSISKLITATAVLQMVENGRLDLDSDVNQYLKGWELPATFEKAVTLRHLLTHTAGLDERRTLIDAYASADERGFVRKLPLLFPARFSSPGTVYSYSNVGYTLAGAIVERYSRQSFSSAVEKKILSPLGMRNSGFVLKADQLQYLAQGYDSGGMEVACKYYYVQPAVGFFTTAADMVRFMISQLQHGKYGNRYILGEKYAKGLFTIQYTPHPNIDGTAIGYYQKKFGNTNVLMHHGDIDGFSSLLVLIPDRNMGFFLSANAENLDFRDALVEALVSRMEDAKAGGVTTTDKSYAGSDKMDVAGSYRHNRVSRNTAEKIFQFMGEQIQVKTTQTGIALYIPPPLGNEIQYWNATPDPLLFERGSGAEYLVFSKDKKERITSMTIRNVYATYDKIPFSETLFGQKAQLFLFVLSACFSVIGLILAMAVNRGRLPWEKEGALAELWVILSLFWLTQICFAVGLWASHNLYCAVFAYTIPFRVKALFLLPMIGCLLLGWFWVRLALYLLSPYYRFLEKAALIILACVATRWIFFLIEWNLLGFKF